MPISEQEMTFLPWECFLLCNLQQKRERPLMTSHVFWPFLVIFGHFLPKYLPCPTHELLPEAVVRVLLYNVRFGGLSWTSLPTIKSDVINGRSQRVKCIKCTRISNVKLQVYLMSRLKKESYFALQ